MDEQKQRQGKDTMIELPEKHHLKSLPHYFQALWVGDKTFEIRKNDRNFKERDEVSIEEWEPKNGYTERLIEGFIRYISDYEQKPGYVVFSIQETRRQE